MHIQTRSCHLEYCYLVQTNENKIKCSRNLIKKFKLNKNKKPLSIYRDKLKNSNSK